MNVKLEIKLPGGETIFVHDEGINFENDKKEDKFSLNWDEVWDAADNWRE